MLRPTGAAAERLIAWCLSSRGRVRRTHTTGTPRTTDVDRVRADARIRRDRSSV
jgi:hypothetical protein